MSFSELSAELTILIGENLGRKDLKSLAGTCTGFRDLLSPILYRFALHPRFRTTAFYCAATDGNERLVRLLLVKGSNFRAEYNIGTRSKEINVPVKDQVVDEYVEYILNKGSRLIVRDIYDHTTPLHKAAKNGRNIIFKRLLDMGADMEAKDMRGWTALHHAVFESNGSAVRLLLGKGAHVNCQGECGETPIHIVARSGNKVIASLLLESGADVALMDRAGLNAADLADAYGQDGLVVLLLRYVSPDFRFRNKKTALHFAANRGNIVMATVHLDNGVNIDTQDGDRITALHEAAACGHDEMVTLLLRRGAKVDVQDSEGSTPLHLSLMVAGLQPQVVSQERRRKNVIKTLLEKGASIEIQSNGGLSAIDHIPGLARVSRNSGQLALVEQLLTQASVNFRTKDVGRTALHLAVEYTSERFIRALLENGADIAKQDNSGWNALHLAARWPSDDAKIRTLLEMGADVAVKTSDGDTAVDISCRCGIIRASLLEKVDINFRTSNHQMTALHLVVQTGNKEVASLLLSRGIDIDAKDGRGRTALHHAAIARAAVMIEVLLENGADGTIKDKSGRLALRRVWSKDKMPRRSARLLTKGLDNSRSLEGHMMRKLAEVSEDDDG